jgi:Zn-dependent peptidase ImmA (M78 family)
MQINFNSYKPSAVELWISSIYQQHDITRPIDLTISNVSNIFNTDVLIYDGPVFAEWEDDVYSFIFLNQDIPTTEQKADFFHELCHPLRHTGCQNKLPKLFRDLQENQAQQFQLVAAMPIYLFNQVPSSLYYEHYINQLSYSFELPKNLVQKRLHQIINNIQSNCFWDRINYIC